MKAFQLTATRKAEIVEIDRPRPGHGEVVVELMAGAICNQSDLRAFSRQHDTPLEAGFPGHEGVGRVVEVGPGVSSLRCGHVVCMTGHGGPPLYREYVLRQANTLIALMGDVDPLPAACLELYGCVWRAIRMAGDLGQSAVVVNGLGPGGLAAVQLLRTFHTGLVVGVDPVADRRERAVEGGADVVVDPTDEDALGRLVASNPPTVIDCTGHPAGVAGAMRIAWRQVVYFGVCFEPVECRQYDWFEKELVLRNSRQLDIHDFGHVVNMYAAGQIEPARLVTHQLHFSDYATAMELLKAGQAIKILLTWS